MPLAQTPNPNLTESVKAIIRRGPPKRVRNIRRGNLTGGAGFGPLDDPAELDLLSLTTCNGLGKCSLGPYMRLKSRRGPNVFPSVHNLLLETNTFERK